MKKIIKNTVFTIIAVAIILLTSCSPQSLDSDNNNLSEDQNNTGISKGDIPQKD